MIVETGVQLILQLSNFMYSFTLRISIKCEVLLLLFSSILVLFFIRWCSSMYKCSRCTLLLLFFFLLLLFAFIISGIPDCLLVLATLLLSSYNGKYLCTQVQIHKNFSFDFPTLQSVQKHFVLNKGSDKLE